MEAGCGRTIAVAPPPPPPVGGASGGGWTATCCGPPASRSGAGRVAAPMLAHSAGRRVQRASATRKSRSEEHTSELQSLAYLVCRLLLEKKKKKHTENNL